MSKEELTEVDTNDETIEKEMKKRYRKGLRRGIAGTAIVCVLVLALPMVIHQIRTGTGNQKSSLNASAEDTSNLENYDEVLDKDTVSKINTLAAYIEANYYEEVDTEDLVNGLYAGLFSNLDQYSTYYTAQEYQELYTDMISGTFYGIGATLQQDPDTMQVSVVNVYEKSPAEEAGIKAGDVIVSADDNEATSMELSEFVTHVRGDEGTKVHLKIYRAGEKDDLELDVTREKLDIPTVSSDMLDEQTGYIRITEFNDNTASQFAEALETLQKKQMKGLVVDLRNNPGGMLQSVTEVLNDIMPKGLLVYTEDRAGNKQEINSTDDTSISMPVAVLVNENSASAAEIFAGAVQDRDFGTLIGTTTFGKGIVQTIQQLSDGSAVKMTTSRYFTPSGVCIQGTGIKPDIELEYKFGGSDTEEYSYEQDNQIQKAIEVLKREIK